MPVGGEVAVALQGYVVDPVDAQPAAKEGGREVVLGQLVVAHYVGGHAAAVKAALPGVRSPPPTQGGENGASWIPLGVPSSPRGLRELTSVGAGVPFHTPKGPTWTSSPTPSPMV